MKYYTFSTIGLNGKKYYPKEMKGNQGDLISDWTENKNKAVCWESPEHFDCLMNEYCNTEVEEVEKKDKLIKVTDVNFSHKFVCFKLPGLEDGILVGLNSEEDGLVINYKGDQSNVPFMVTSNFIEALNKGLI